MNEGMNSDASMLMERLNEIEARLRSLEAAVRRREVVVLDEDHLRSAREAADQFLALSEKARGRWRGTLGAVEEVRRMRKHQRGY
jgi:hypothetical protein